MPLGRSSGGKRHFAIGRKRERGEQNKTEARFEREWIMPRVMAQEIAWFAFEAIKLRLADATFFTADFSILPVDGVLEIIDVKGSPRIVEEDARVKIKVAAELFPFRFFFAWPLPKAEGGGWHRDEI